MTACPGGNTANDKTKRNSNNRFRKKVSKSPSFSPFYFPFAAYEHMVLSEHEVNAQMPY